MNGPPVEVNSQQLEELARAVQDLRRRVALLEQRGLLTGEAGGPSLASSTITASTPALGDVPTGVLSAVGRLLLGIAGAFLLRAITESAVIPQLAGTLVGLMYAYAWLVASARTGSANKMAIALQALTAALIAGPLLWEATVRFHSLTPTGGAAALTLFMVLGEVAAWRRDSAVLAGVTLCAGTVTAIVLIEATFALIPFAIALLAAAAVTEYGASRGRGLSVRWIVALAADFAVFLLAYIATRPEGLPEGYAPTPARAVAVALFSLAAIYLTSPAIRTLLENLRVTWFEIAQAVASVAIALWGGTRLAHGSALAAIGWVCMAVAAFGYLAAFGFAGRERVLHQNFHAFSTLAIALMGIGGLLSLPNFAVAALWSALAIVSVLLAQTRGNTLLMHGAVYSIAALSVSGGLSHAVVTLIGVPGRRWPEALWGAFVSLAAAFLVFGLILRSRPERVRNWMDRVPSAIVAGALCWTLAGLAAGWLIRPGTDASLVSTIRTALVAGVALGLAWMGSRWNLPELIWILYPWMIGGALKLLAEDFRQGGSKSLFVSLLLYGGTLAVLPNLIRRAERARTC